ncbi:MAG: exodeoxyribonuclease III [Deltaproteobacteria bacterium]|nr:exodeoxyribonuclease III [Deltaproteobacteria bacterium]
MKIISWNVNGIRACIKKGFWEWFYQTNADIVCLQETKIMAVDFLKIAREYNLIPLLNDPEELPFDEQASSKGQRPPIYYALACAKKPGYSGVAILTKIRPQLVTIGLGRPECDNEGRTIIADFDKFTLVNVYVPNGGRELERIPFKLKFNEHLLKVLQKKRSTQKNIICCGDMNVAHQEIDIKNPKSNENNSGFTLTERESFTKFLGHDYIDTYRHLHPDTKDVYSWWSYRPGVREKNIGWRIDYFVVTPDMLGRVKKAEVHMDQWGSDHCPISLVLT